MEDLQSRDVEGCHLNQKLSPRVESSAAKQIVITLQISGVN